MKFKEFGNALFICLKIIFFKCTNKKIIIINEAAGLGDYIWTRNYFRLLKIDPKYSMYKIVFLGTKRWAEFAKAYDSKYVDLFYFFKKPYSPTFLELIALRIFHFDIFINFRFNDDLWNKMIKTIRAQNIFNYEANGNFVEESKNNFFKTITNISDDFQHELPILYIPKHLPEKPFIVYTPSGYSVGELNNNIGLSIIKYYCEKSINVCILGTKSDINFFEYISKNIDANLQKYLYNACGKYKIYELPYIINESNFIVTPDTSILHFAIQLKKKVICLYKKTVNKSKNAHYIDIENCLDIVKKIEEV